MAEPERRPRRTFGPVVLLGLAAGGLTAFAGTRQPVQTPYDALTLRDQPDQPLVTALGLVVLACWGVVLVTRGRVRRAVAVLALVASLGVLVAAVVGWAQAPDDLAARLREAGVSQPEVERTVWGAVAVLGAGLSVVATALAVRLAPSWPEMGSRYDAPTGAAAPPPKPAEEQSSLDLWKAIDEGRDPTAPDARDPE